MLVSTTRFSGWSGSRMQKPVSLPFCSLSFQHSQHRLQPLTPLVSHMVSSHSCESVPKGSSSPCHVQLVLDIAEQPENRLPRSRRSPGSLCCGRQQKPTRSAPLRRGSKHGHWQTPATPGYLCAAYHARLIF